MTDTSLEQPQPSVLIKLIAIKKGIFGLILIAISIISTVSWQHFDLVTSWAETYVINAEYGFVRWALNAIAHSTVPTLKWVARISGAYGLLLEVAAVGLWQGRAWADPLFIALVGLLIPVEILELVHHATPTKAIIFAINVLIFSLIVKRWLGERNIQNVQELS